MGYEYESDPEEKKFIEVFRFKRGDGIDKCLLEAKFLRNPEASAASLEKVDLGKLEKELDIAFIPPALARRSEESGINPEQYIMQAFFKGKMYDGIKRAAEETNDQTLLELDFVLNCNTAAGKLLTSLEKEEGQIDFKEAWTKWEPIFKAIVKDELTAKKTGGGAAAKEKEK